MFLPTERLQLSIQKPEQLKSEDASEIRNKLQLEDTPVQKHLTKLRQWQQMLENINLQQKKAPGNPQGPLPTWSRPLPMPLHL